MGVMEWSWGRVFQSWFKLALGAAAVWMTFLAVAEYVSSDNGRSLASLVAGIVFLTLLGGLAALCAAIPWFLATRLEARRRSFERALAVGGVLLWLGFMYVLSLQLAWDAFGVCLPPGRELFGGCEVGPL